MDGIQRKVAWVIGGGSGMGRASAEALASTGWKVVVSGRRAGALERTAADIRSEGGAATALQYDLVHADARVAVESILSETGRIDGVVLAAGLNTPHRTWSDQSFDEFDAIVQTNLVGTARTLAAALPSLRATAGVAVVISSYAGWTYQPSAGVAYSASKSALGSLVRSFNTQGAPNGVRACHLCPGDVDSDFLHMRPQPPTESARAAMLTASDIGRAVTWVMNAPPHIRVDELVISPVSQF